MLSRLRFLVLLGVVAIPLAADDEEMSRIRVEVLTLGGRPVDRASVIVNFGEGRSIVKFGKKIITHWELRTNQEGIARVPALPYGKVRIQVIAKGYQTFGQSYDLGKAEESITIKLNTPQPQHSEHQ